MDGPLQQPRMILMRAGDILSMPGEWFAANLLAIAGAVLVLLAGWFLSRFVYGLVHTRLPRAYGVDKNFAPLLAQAARYGIILFALVTALSFLGVPSASIYAVLGAMGLAIALALQGTLSNIAAGIMLIWQRPIAIGEYISGDGVEGTVVEIGLFGTRLRSGTGPYVFTPNQRLWAAAITNFSREPRRRIDINFLLPEAADVVRARQAVLKVATGNPKVLADPAPSVHVDAFVLDRVALQLQAWAATADFLETQHALAEGGKAALNFEAYTGDAGKVEVTVPPGPPSAGD